VEISAVQILVVVATILEVFNFGRSKWGRLLCQWQSNIGNAALTQRRLSCSIASYSIYKYWEKISGKVQKLTFF